MDRKIHRVTLCELAQDAPAERGNEHPVNQIDGVTHPADGRDPPVAQQVSDEAALESAVEKQPDGQHQVLERTNPDGPEGNDRPPQLQPIPRANLQFLIDVKIGQQKTEQKKLEIIRQNLATLASTNRQRRGFLPSL